MRTLLRHIPSGLYFQGPDQWTSDPKRACDFRTVTRALKFVQKAALEEMEFVFSHDTPGITAVPVARLPEEFSSSTLDRFLATLVASGCGRRASA